MNAKQTNGDEKPCNKRVTFQSTGHMVQYGTGTIVKSNTLYLLCLLLLLLIINYTPI